jgi:hypothetical protein
VPPSRSRGARRRARSRRPRPEQRALERRLTRSRTPYADGASSRRSPACTADDTAGSRALRLRAGPCRRGHTDSGARRQSAAGRAGRDHARGACGASRRTRGRQTPATRASPQTGAATRPRRRAGRAHGRACARVAPLTPAVRRPHRGAARSACGERGRARPGRQEGERCAGRAPGRAEQEALPVGGDVVGRDRGREGVPDDGAREQPRAPTSEGRVAEAGVTAAAIRSPPGLR